MCITGIQLCNVYTIRCVCTVNLLSKYKNIIYVYIIVTTHPNDSEKQSYIAFYETRVFLKQKCGWKEWGTDSFVWFNNYRHKENIYRNVF